MKEEIIYFRQNPIPREQLREILGTSDYIVKLRNYGKKTISKTDLELLFLSTGDEELFRIVSDLIGQHVLSPVKNSATNGNRQYPLHEKYKIIIPEYAPENELREIGSLHPILLSSGYLQNNPSSYVKHKELLNKLDRHLFARGNNTIAVSKKERSFEIFDEEKVLDDSAFCAFLGRLGITAETLKYYDTPEYCFNDYIPERKPRMTLLIYEKKDIWFNIRRMMFEDHKDVIFGTHIDGVVYGCGNKVSGRNALIAYTNFIGADVNYLYWGDIDRAGLNIFLSTLRNNQSLHLQLFVPAYEEMLRLARNRCIPKSDDEREHLDNYDPIYELIDPLLQPAMVESILNNKRIPQEIITYATLKELMR